MKCIRVRRLCAAWKLCAAYGWSLQGMTSFMRCCNTCCLPVHARGDGDSCCFASQMNEIQVCSKLRDEKCQLSFALGVVHVQAKKFSDTNMWLMTFRLKLTGAFCSMTRHKPQLYGMLIQRVAHNPVEPCSTKFYFSTAFKLHYCIWLLDQGVAGCACRR